MATMTKLEILLASAAVLLMLAASLSRTSGLAEAGLVLAIAAIAFVAGRVWRAKQTSH
jgi:hypothetical protein